MELRVVGVVGAGVMGIGLGQNLAQTGHQVVLLDVSEAQLGRAKDEIRKNLRFHGMFQKQTGQKVDKPASADEVLGRIKFTTTYDDFSETDCVVVNDYPGFVSNRVHMLTVNEAVYLLHDGVATAEQVDHLFKTCFGHKMGPLETADLIGLDTILYSIEVLYESYSDSKYRPCPLLRKMVDAGLHGRKNGKGFYDYSASL